MYFYRIAEYNKPTDLYAINKLYVEIKNAEIKIPTDGIDEINVSIKVRIATMTNNKIIQPITLPIPILFKSRAASGISAPSDKLLYLASLQIPI